MEIILTILSIILITVWSITITYLALYCKEEIWNEIYKKIIKEDTNENK